MVLVMFPWVSLLWQFGSLDVCSLAMVGRYELFRCLLYGLRQMRSIIVNLTIGTTDRTADTVHCHVKMEQRFRLHVDYTLCRLTRAAYAFVHGVALLGRSMSESPPIDPRYMTIITIHVRMLR
jgi:hypothetical protein